ncbi:MAG: diguanylate cyclase [Clostridiales bacterium]|jgi:diguanylate cyclase (GGDEF)-like protein/PAS domain S-box-containing protein|nr:diguanylate cyclase [Clostridiales bacterium]
MNSMQISGNLACQNHVDSKTMSAIHSSINGGIIVTDTDDNFSIYYISAECLDMLGYTEAEWIESFGRTSPAFLTADDRYAVQSAVRRQLEICGKVHYAYRIYKKNGSLSWVLLQGCLQVQTDGVERFCGSLLYVCDFKTTINLAPVSEAYYRIVLERLGYILFDYDIETNRIYFSKTASEKYGIPTSIECDPEILVQKGLLNPSSAKRFTRAIEDVKNGKPVTHMIIQLSGKNRNYFWCDVMVSTLYEDGMRISHALGIIRNITRQREKERRLLRECRYHQAVLKSAKYIYKINVTKDIILKGHEDWQKRFGLTPSPSYTDMLSLVTAKWLHPDDSERLRDGLSRTSLIACFENGQTCVSLECRRAELGKPFMWIKCTSNLLRDPDSGDIMSLCTIKSIENRKKREVEMQYLAERDSLSKLYNHRATKSHITAFLETGEGLSGQHAMLIMDIDDFKKINDTHGHLYGDNLLAKISDTVQTLFRSTDILGRVGGDEFVFFFKNISAPDMATGKAVEVNRVIQNLYSQYDDGLSVTVSIGIALYPSHGVTYDELYANADKALYKAKKDGKDTVALFE